MNIKNKKFLDKEFVKSNLLILEETLRHLDIFIRVVETKVEEEYLEFLCEVALGTHIRDIIAVKDDIALALASPTGGVEITAPIKGRALISIKLPLRNSFERKKGKYKIIRIVSQPKRQSLLEYLAEFFADLLLVISNLFLWSSRLLRNLMERKIN